MVRVQAYVLVKSEAGKVRAVRDAIAGLVEVKSANALAGPTDMIVLVEGESHKAVADLIIAKLHTIPGVKETDTRFVVDL